MKAVYQGPLVFIPDGVDPAGALVELAQHWETKARQAPTATLRKEFMRRAHEIRKAESSTDFKVVPGGLTIPLFLDTNPNE